LSHFFFSILSFVSFFKATCEVVKKLVALNPNENRFNLIGLVPKDGNN
jgi:hypothetical protein